jgi:serine/threonine protein kinase
MSTFAKSPSASVPDLTGRYIHHNLYRCDRVIGRGAWGIVYLGTKITEPGSKYAIKAISTLDRDGRVLDNIAREVALQTAACSFTDGVLRIIDTSEDHELGLLYIITEYCPDGDLLEAILAGKYVRKDDLIRDVFLQLVDAVETCHKQSIFHRDLKPENILCKDGGEKVVIADFGFATEKPVTTDFHMGSEPFMSPGKRNANPCRAHDLLTLHPEIRGGIHARVPTCSSRQGDVWALGVILMTIVVGSLPWQKASLRDKYFVNFLYDPDFLYRVFPISRGLNYTLKGLFHPDPMCRITIKELRARVMQIEKFTTTRTELIRPMPTAPVKQERAATQPRETPVEKAAAVTNSFERAVLRLVALGGNSDSKETIFVPLVDDGERTEDDMATIGDDTTLITTILSSQGVEPGTPSLFVNETPPLEETFDEAGPSRSPEQVAVRKTVRTAPPGELVSEDEEDIFASYVENNADSDMDSDTDSDDESEGPITPETRPADHTTPAVVALEDIPAIDADSEMIDETTAITPATTLPITKAVDEITPPTIAPPVAHVRPQRPTAIDLSYLSPVACFALGVTAGATPLPEFTNTNVAGPSIRTYPRTTQPQPQPQQPLPSPLLPLKTPPEIRAHIPLAARMPLAYRAVKYAKERVHMKGAGNAATEKFTAGVKEDDEERSASPIRWIVTGKKVRITNARV